MIWFTPTLGSDEVSFALAVKEGVEYNGKKYDAIYPDFKDDKALSGDDDVRK